MNLQPVFDKVLIDKKPPETMSPGGIHLPERAQEKTIEGRVVAVGPGIYQDGKLIPMIVKVGDTVLYSRYGGWEITEQGKDYVLIKQDELLAIRRVSEDDRYEYLMDQLQANMTELKQISDGVETDPSKCKASPEYLQNGSMPSYDDIPDGETGGLPVSDQVGMSLRIPTATATLSEDEQKYGIAGAVLKQEFVAIETYDGEGKSCEWGVSNQGPNPSPEYFFPCDTKEEALAIINAANTGDFKPFDALCSKLRQKTRLELQNA